MFVSQKQELSPIDLEYIYEIIDQSYIKIPILYNSIKQIKLDPNFILSVNNYFNRLKSNIYKDLIREETLLRNGKNHTRNLISFIRSICKISYKQATEISNNSFSSKYAIIYTMTAIDYILQTNFPQRKLLFNYILMEYISMWLHENLRIIQEDFSIIVENGRNKIFFSLCICLFNKLESICAINWERLQMIQKYRLTHFDQLFKSTNIQLETNKDFILVFGKSLKLTMKKSEIPITLLYSNRTNNELINIDEVHQIFRKSIAKILLSESIEMTSNSIHTHQSYSQSSFNEQNPLFIEEFRRVLRKELEDAEILRKIDCRQLNEDSQNIGYLSFQTRNILKLPKNKDTNTTEDNIDQNYISIEVIHDPSRCSSNSKSIVSSKSNNQQRWYWIDSLSKDCLITPNSLFCPQKSFDKNTYSITVEHNEEFR